MQQLPSKVLVHIGYHKTGTTWLQRNLFVDSSKHFFNLSLKASGNSSLSHFFKVDEDGYMLSPFDVNGTRISGALEEIRQRKNDLWNTKVAVLTDEELSGNPHSSGHNAHSIAERIHATFSDAHVLIVVREQKEFLLSNYIQYLSMGGTHSINKYLTINFSSRRPYFGQNHIKYHHLIEFYHNCFDVDRLLVLPYELFREKPKDFIQCIGNLVEVEIMCANFDFTKKMNSKTSYFTEYYLRFLNHLERSNSLNNYSSLHSSYSRLIVRGAKAVTKKVATGLNLDPSTKSNLSIAIENWTQDRFIHSNEVTQNYCPVDLRQYGYF